MLSYASERNAEERLASFLSDSFETCASLPFSFTYGGAFSGELLNGWERRIEENGISFLSPDGLKLWVDIRTFPDFPAVEWLLRFENTGTADSALLSDIHALDVYFETAPFRTAGTQQYGALDNLLYYNGGSDCKADDFIPCMEILHHISVREEMHFGSSLGRPTSGSHGAFPYFNLKTYDRGVFFAIGWSGQWSMTLRTRQKEWPDAPDAFRFTGDIDEVSTVLHPGESIRTARILLMPWDGAVEDSNRQSRRFLLKYHTPHLHGKPAVLPVTVGSWGFGEERNCKEIDTIKTSGLPIDTYWVDAGWYGPAGTRCDDAFCNDWATHVGWYDEDPSRFPHGLGTVGDRAHEAGMGFLVWHEPDRAVIGSPSQVDHPEFYLDTVLEFNSRMFNLGREDAYRWMLEMLSERIRRFHLDVLRIDYNVGPLKAWRANDTENRKGMTEIGAVTNFYRLWDELRARFPHLLIDNCASGGRRLDFEACSRSVTLFRTDYFCYADCAPHGLQVQTGGLAPFVPLNGTTLQVDSELQIPTWYTFISSLAAAISINMATVTRTLEDEAFSIEFRKMLSVHARYRDLLTGDYDALSGVTLDERDMFAYQLFDPETGKGCLVAIRRAQCPFPEAEYSIRGPKPGVLYDVEDGETGEICRMTGEELLKGLSVCLTEKKTARILFFTPCKP